MLSQRGLPAMQTSFVDRRRETAHIVAVMGQARLVTLTGPPGVGKSRLAVQVAAQRSRAFTDGVWLIELAHLRDPALVAHTVAHAVGMRDTGTGDAAESLARFLINRHLLLILDNCEHLADACARLADLLLRTSASLRMLATSREVLRILGEHLVVVEPLETAAAVEDSRPGRRDPADPPAVELFTQRAVGVLPSFVLTEQNRPQVIEVCRRLEGLPLAIELAAARVREVSVEQLHAWLGEQVAALDVGASGGDRRQRDVRRAIEWSYQLCEPAERLLWRRLSVFAGPAGLAAIEHVCGGDGVTGSQVLDLIGCLVDKSILISRQQAGEVSYAMLEMLRGYGLSRLREAGEDARLRAAHAREYRRLAEQAGREWFGPRQAACFGRLRGEHANVRAALDHYLAAGDTESALRLGTALWFHWVFSGRVAEGRLWLQRALAQPGGPTVARAGALWCCSLLASQQGDLADSVRLAESAHAMAVQVDDPLTVARSVARLAIVAYYRQQPESAAALIADATARYTALGQADSPYVVMAQLTLAAALLERGELAAAEELCQQCAATCRAHGDHILLGNTLTLLADRERLGGRLEQAAEHAREGIRLAGVDTPAHTLGQLIDLSANIAADAGAADRAAVLLGAAEKVWRSFGLERMMHAPRYERRREQSAAGARRVLGGTGYQAAYDRGVGMTLQQVVDFAANTGTARPAARADTSRPALTRRERQIADLVAEGLTNREIASRLTIAPRTAESHVSTVLTKLGMNSRAQIAGWSAQHRTDPPE
jgi:predicted ATPase/DNA-binding CsgD family transcriptional regulator